MVVLPNIRRKYMVSRLPQGATVDIAECLVSLANDSVPYTGSARTVGVTVTWGGAALTVNTDYTLAFANNVNVGAATVTVTGMGQFAGSVTKTFYISSSILEPTEWSGIDLSNVDLSNVRSENFLPAHHLQVINDNCLFFCDNLHGIMCTWSFEDGHPFEVEYRKTHETSATSSNKVYVGSTPFDPICASITPNGKFIYFSVDSNYFRFEMPVERAFDLSSCPGSYDGGLQAAQKNDSYLVSNKSMVHFSRDGMYLAAKGINGNGITVRKANTPYSYDGLNVFSSYNFSNYDSAIRQKVSVQGGSVVWKDFCLSNDGSIMIATLVVNDLLCVARIDFATPWDVRTGSMHSAFVHDAPVSDGNDRARYYSLGVAVNSTGTKLLVLTGVGVMFEYDLV